MLYVFGNPEPLRSSFSQELRRHAQRSEASILLLSDHLKDGAFSTPSMQAAVEQADSIVIHAPVYWYGAPALVKAWMDQILTPGWAFPSHESKLLGKSIAMSLTVGAAVDTYQPGKSNRHTLETYFLPYQQAFEYCGMNWKGLAACKFPQQPLLSKRQSSTSIKRLSCLAHQRK